MKHSHSQIVATLGPSSRNPAVVRKMIEHQMDVVRLNFSHGIYDEHAHYIKTTRALAKELGRHLPIIQDLSGPRLNEAGGHRFGGTKGSVITEKDKADLKFGIDQSVDYVAMSYIGSAGDVLEMKTVLKEHGAMVPIIAKIERRAALENIDAIIRVSDAIMIARGDLGQSIPIEQVPFAERTIIKKCNAAKKPVITATEMLFTMVVNPRPTRAEVTDVAFAILEGSDAVMLSDETAKGKYPIEAIRVMEKVVLEAEKHHPREINSLK
jgi:pyruvate kinase